MVADAEQQAGRPIVDAAIMRDAADDAAPADAATAAAPTSSPDVRVDWPAEARELLDFAHSLYVPLFPSLGLVYTVEVRATIAARAAPVMQKYNVNLARLFGRYGDEIMLAAAILPLIPPTIAAINHDRKPKAIDAKKTESETGEAPAHVGTTGKMHAPAAGDSPLARFRDANAGGQD